VTSRPSRRLLAPLAAAGALALAGAPSAGAQTTTGQAGGPSLSPAPPVSLGHAKKPKKTTPTSTTTSKPASKRASSVARSSRQLPNTGYDAWAVALLGGGLMAAGVGLRLRTRDVRWP
jgi:LPXTG-motif cell wall-anchored protein